MDFKDTCVKNGGIMFKQVKRLYKKTYTQQKRVLGYLWSVFILNWCTRNTFINTLYIYFLMFYFAWKKTVVRFDVILRLKNNYEEKLI